MKIVHVSHLYYPSEGGVQTFFKNISERLVRDYGDEVTVVTSNSYYGTERKIFKKIEPAEEIINGVKIIRFPFTRWHVKLFSVAFKVFKKLSLNIPEWMTLVAYGPMSQSMKRFLLQTKADAYCGSPSNYIHMQLPRWKACNFFYYGSIHLDADKAKQHLPTNQLKAIKASSLYLANTNYEKTCLISLGVQHDKIFVLGTGVDLESFDIESTVVTKFRKEIGLEEGDLLLGYVGRIERPKNVILLVKSFEKIAQKFSNVHLLIAGSGKQHVEELRLIIAGFPAGVSRRIHWELNFSTEKKAVIFNSLDIFILPSNNESFGLVFLEAWSCRKPVIGSAIGAVCDVITENEDGLIIDINSEESLIDKISILIRNPKLRDEMGEKGFKKVEENYTWDIITKRLRSCYKQSINSNTKRAIPEATKA